MTHRQILRALLQPRLLAEGLVGFGLLCVVVFAMSVVGWTP